MAVGHNATSGKVDIEHLSSLIDGELDAREAAAVIDALCRDAELQHRWSDLQLVGDALRSTEVAACHVDGFCARVRRALADEPDGSRTVARPPWLASLCRARLRRRCVGRRHRIRRGSAVAGAVA